MNCVSRTDYGKDKNLFKDSNIRKRWNLYSQIDIDNDTLRCSNEVYNLTELCNLHQGSKPCTLRDTNEVVDIEYSFQDS